MTTYYSSQNSKELTFGQNTINMDTICVCCSTQDDTLIKLNSCKHTTFLTNNIKLEFDLHSASICVICHNMLRKIELFKQQVEENIALLTDQIHILKPTKLHDLKLSSTHIDDSTQPEVEIKPEVNLDLETDVKVEHDSSDYDTEPLSSIKKKKEVNKYEGKIRVVKLSVEELNQERELMAKQEKYLGLPYKCEDCVIGFDHEITWKSHMEKRHKKSKNGFQCDVCKSVLNSKNSYNEHTKRHVRRIECMECGKRYNHEQSALQHYDDNHMPAGSSLQRNYTCRDCGFTTTSNRTYRYHMDKHRQKRECEICFKTFVNPNSLKMHMYTVHQQSSRVYSCVACNKTYRAKSGLVAHARAVHATAPRAYCHLCHTHYMTNNALQTHLNTHSKHVTDSDKRYICDECGAKFIKKHSLQIHINWEHLKLNTHRCVKCSKVFKSAPSLRRHVNYVHEKQRPPRNKICHYCGRGFTTQNILQSHLRTHTGERPLQCQHCRATFAHSGALYTHIKLKHNGLAK
ncbi:uncharacterized protein LOC142985464 [Anticarsia gemmatalis]|uniref:uncharacterized protein LOC142985464 n=1 Tax=Anticarsia gemmatalis TaxID=129554 RepID=UPI003F75FD8B